MIAEHNLERGEYITGYNYYVYQVTPYDLQKIICDMEMNEWNK